MDFEIGDRICKVRGINSGKSGTIRSILPNGTVGVIFDGEKTVRYCDPGNCEKPTMIPVATNAAFKVGQRVTDGNRTFIVKKVFSKWQDLQSEFGSNFHRVSDLFKNKPGVYYKDDSGHIVHEKDITGVVNSANAKFRKGDRVKIGDGRIGIVIDDNPTMTDYIIRLPSGSIKGLKTSEIVSANAKFNIGDKVWVTTKDGFTRRATIESYFNRNGGIQYHVAFIDGNGTDMIPESKVSKASNSTATNAKFKIGDLICLNSETLNSQNTGVTEVRRVTDKIAAFLSNALYTNAKTSYADILTGTNVIRISFDFSPNVDKDVYMKKESSIKTEIVRIVKTVIPKASPSVRSIASGKVIYRVECNFVYNDYKGSPQYVGTNAATDAEFEKIKAMGKTAVDKYFRDNYQSFIDKYGFKDALELCKRISRIKYKPIKKGRFAGKGPDGMTYYVEYTNDRWFAKNYGKDGTNVTEIQIQGPWVKDPDGKERRHILYLYGSGSERIHPANPAVAQLVKQIMRGPDVLKQDAADYAWNEEVTSSNPVVANALKAARNSSLDPQWVKDAQDAITAIRSGGFPRQGIEGFYSRYGKYTMDGLHRTGEVQRIAEKLNDLKFDVEKSYEARQKAIKLLYAVQRIKAPKE